VDELDLVRLTRLSGVLGRSAAFKGAGPSRGLLGLPGSFAKPYTGLISIRKLHSGTDQNFFNGRQSFGITGVTAHFDIIDRVAMKASR
jgi:hypothetical protein